MSDSSEPTTGYLVYMSTGIYSITCTVNNKMYIGCSDKIKGRLTYHKWALNRNKHKNIHLQRAWNKYESSYFKFERIEICSKELLFEREDYWCKLLKVHQSEYGYNMIPTSTKPYNPRSEECKQNISKGHKNIKYHTVEERAKAKASYGKEYSKKYYYENKEEFLQETKEYRKRNPEKLREWRKAEKERAKVKRALNPKKKGIQGTPVFQYNINNVLIKEWCHVTEAAKILGISRNTILVNIKRGCIPNDNRGGHNRIGDQEKYKCIWSYENISKANKVTEKVEI